MTGERAAASADAVAPDDAVGRWLGAGGSSLRATERVAVAAAAGRVLAAPARAARPSPPATCAAMDGIAVIAADVAAAPVLLPAAAFDRIDTGQALPDGRDAVVMREVVELHADGSCTVLEPVIPGRHVRPRGEDIAEGAELLPAGALLDAGRLAVLLAAGLVELDVARRPHVAIVPTGDEIRPAGRAAPGDVVDSNGPMLAALVTARGCRAEVVEPVADDPEALRAALRAAAASSDLVCVIAGTSKGARDHVPDVLRREGRVDVERLAVRPGSPTLLGHLGATPIACLPGYPVAAWVVAHLDVLPALALLGAAPLPPRVHGVLARAVDVRADATTVHPAVVAPDAAGVLRVEPLPRKASRLSVLGAANALAILPPGAPGEAGAIVVVQPSA